MGALQGAADNSRVTHGKEVDRRVRGSARRHTTPDDEWIGRRSDKIFQDLPKIFGGLEGLEVSASLKGLAYHIIHHSYGPIVLCYSCVSLRSSGVVVWALIMFLFFSFFFFFSFSIQKNIYIRHIHFYNRQPCPPFMCGHGAVIGLHTYSRTTSKISPPLSRLSAPALSSFFGTVSSPLTTHHDM
jgi:hypothetical protein